MSVELYRWDCMNLMGRLPSASVDMVFCDLPYGITANSWDCVIPVGDLFNIYRRLVKEHHAIVLTASEPFTSVLITQQLKHFRYRIIWDKVNRVTGFLQAKKRPMKIVEDVVVFSFGSGPKPYHPPKEVAEAHKGGWSGKLSENWGGGDGGMIADNVGDKWPFDLLRIPALERGEPRLHPTQKAVRLVMWFLETFTAAGDVVLDNCMGVGTTGVACVRMKRSFIGIEKDKKYFELAKQRIEREQGLRRDIVKPDSFQKTFIESIAEGMA